MYLTNQQFVSQKKYILQLIQKSNILDNGERIRFSEKYLKDKKILNIGCLNHDISAYNQQHDDIKKLSQITVGVDIVSEAKELGENIEIGDICNKKFCESILEKYGTFDIVFAGELIEHLDNYKLFAENVATLLNKGGFLIVSTPNPHGLHYQLQNFLYGYMPEGNTDHTCRIDVFQLCFNLKNYFTLVNFSRLNNTKSIEHKIIRLIGKKQLCFNYIAILQKNEQ